MRFLIDNFMYRALGDLEKSAIDMEISYRLKKMIIKNGGFDYSKRKFNDCVFGIIVHNKVIRNILGNNTMDYFSIKEEIVRARAEVIAQELERNRPSRELLYRYIEMCEIENIEPSLDFLFDAKVGEKVVKAYDDYLKEKNEKNMLRVLDTISLFNYTKSSNIRCFKYLAKSFAPANETEKTCCPIM